MADENYDTILRTAAALAASTGPLAISPVPEVDLVFIATIWSAMMAAIAEEAGCYELNAEVTKKIVFGVIAGAGAYWTGCKFFTWILAKIPVVGWVTGSGINSGLNVVFTLWMGFALIDLFEGPDLKLNDVPTIIEQLMDAMKPRTTSDKIKRIMSFFKRVGGNLQQFFARDVNSQDEGNDEKDEG